MSLLLLSNSLLSQAAERYQFNLPAMNAASALDKLADISGYSLIYPFGDSTVIITNPLSGTYTLEGALTALLLNTPLNATATKKRVIAVSSMSPQKTKQMISLLQQVLIHRKTPKKIHIIRLMKLSQNVLVLQVLAVLIALPVKH